MPSRILCVSLLVNSFLNLTYDQTQPTVPIMLEDDNDVVMDGDSALVSGSAQPPVSDAYVHIHSFLALPLTIIIQLCPTTRNESTQPTRASFGSG